MTYQIGPDLQRLIGAHPLLFRGEAPTIHSYLPAGWFHRVDSLCSALEDVLGAKWCAKFEVTQIKEKFGSLRFYYRLGEREDHHVDMLSPGGRAHYLSQPPAAGDMEIDAIETRIRELVAAACSTSAEVCEACGAPAQLRNLGGYLSTLCDRHLAETRHADGDQS